MDTMTLLWTIWAGFAAAIVALLVYRAQLTRYEDDQLFLNDAIRTEEQQLQLTIVRKLNRVQPLVRIVGGAATAMSICMLSIYVWDAIKSL